MQPETHPRPSGEGEQDVSPPGRGRGGCAASVIYHPANWLDPLDWRDVFGSDRPVEIDLGCGKGGFLVWVAGQRAGHNFLGVERQLKRLRKVDKKVLRAGLANVRLLRVEAGYFVAKLVPDHSVAAYHILFPDPWPKRRHAKHRLFQPAFVDELYRTLGQGGVVNVATDDADYFAHIREVMSEKFVETKPEVLPSEAMTEFEKIFVAEGKPIARARFHRRQAGLPSAQRDCCGGRRS
jgi:tRNA (guanine-N7-)-methyltransferase